VLLAYADRAWRQQYLATVEITTRTAVPVTKVALKREVELIRERGLETAVDIFAHGLSAIAAPVMDDAGQCVACIGIAGPTDRIRPGLKAMQESVREAAAAASKALAAAPAPLATGRRRAARTA
jgi:DNA-binding IclR family transcriptional regulator